MEFHLWVSALFCASEAQNWVEDYCCKWSHQKKHEFKRTDRAYSQIKDAAVLAKGADYLGTLIAATW